MKKRIGIVLALILAFVLNGCVTPQLPAGARLVLRDTDIGRINVGLEKDDFVLAIPTGTEAKPTGCPGNKKRCIWLCTGDDPLDSIDDQTCSTNTWICFSCGSSGGDVCQDGEGKTVPCS